MRKINSLLVVIIGVMLAFHGIMSALYLAGVLNYSPNYQMSGRRLFIVLCAHMLISFYLMIKDRIKQKKMKLYTKLIKGTKRQAVSGIAIVLFTGMHIMLYGIDSAVNTPNGGWIVVFHLIADFMLITSLKVHLTVSIPKLFVSLGIVGHQKGYYQVEAVSKVIMTVLWICLVISEMLFYLM